VLFHYTREHGPEGCILSGEGEAAGVELATLLNRGALPIKAALELGAALADILSIAVQDEMVHGDIKPGLVRVDVAGAVSIDGWGPQRQTCRAPEPMPVGPSTDVYALGVVLHALLADESLGALPRDPDDHDDMVVRKILAMDFGDVAGKRWVQDVQQFLALCMAFDAAERPEALDVANVLAHVSDQCPEPGLGTWAARTIPRISGDAAPPRATPEPQPAEQLEGPTTSQGPLQTGMFKSQTRTAPAAKGEATAFWTKDKIAAMLAEEDAEFEDERAAVAPAPRAPTPPVQPAPAPRAPAPRPAPAPASAPVRPAPAPARPQPTPPRPQPAPPAQGPVAAGPVAAGPVAAGPIAAGPIAAGPVAAGPTAPTPAPSPAKKGGMGKFIVIGLLLLLLGAVAVAGIGGVAFFVLRDSPSESELVDLPSGSADIAPEPAAKDTDAPDPEPAPEPERAPAPAPKATPTPAPKPATSSARTTGSSGGSASSGRSTSPSGAPTTPAEPNPDEVATGGDYTVRFVAQGAEATLECFDGRDKVEFINATRQSFTGVVTCRVHIDGAMGVVQIRQEGTVACVVSGGKVSCAAQ
jgi:hypothetical protein